MGRARPGSATIHYVFSQMTTQLPASQTEAAIRRPWRTGRRSLRSPGSPGTNSTAPQTVNIVFATGRPRRRLSL